MTFWASAAVVPLIVRQPLTDPAEHPLRVGGRMVVWWGSRVEHVSALGRLEREQILSSQEIEDALATLACFPATG